MCFVSAHLIHNFTFFEHFCFAHFSARAAKQSAALLGVGRWSWVCAEGKDKVKSALGLFGGDAMTDEEEEDAEEAGPHQRGLPELDSDDGYVDEEDQLRAM